LNATPQFDRLLVRLWFAPLYNEHSARFRLRLLPAAQHRFDAGVRPARQLPSVAGDGAMQRRDAWFAVRGAAPRLPTTLRGRVGCWFALVGLCRGSRWLLVLPRVWFALFAVYLLYYWFALQTRVPHHGVLPVLLSSAYLHAFSVFSLTACAGVDG